MSATAASTATSAATTTNQAIRDWVHDFYHAAEVKPRFLLLVGDVEQVPGFDYHQSVSDLSYVTVDGDDFLIWQAAFNVDDRGDANGDGVTNGDDFLIWQTEFGSGSGSASAAVPEPTAIVLLSMLAAVEMLFRRATSG